MFVTVASSPGWYLALAISLFNVAAAAVVLWYARKIHLARSAAPLLKTQPPPSTRQTQFDPEEARELLQRLSELAATTAHDVGEHSTRMQNVSEQISAVSSVGDDPLRASLLAAAAQMLEANEQLQAELAETKAELQGHTKRVEVLMAEARTDALAGVANRRALDEELARCYAAWQRQGRPLSLLILDVDHFKKFNDTYGHQAGDEVLRNIGRVLAASVRDMDFAARYGGEEFAFVLPGTRLEDAKSAAERIRNAIARAKIAFAGKDLQVTVSVGLAELHSGDTVASFLKHADTALYAAKTNGRNRSYYYDGATCRAVDSAAVAVRAEVGKVVHQQLVEVASDDSSSDRRTQARYNFARVQSVAPYVAGRVPAADEFREVQCRDLTSSGISFWLPAPPAFSSLVLALGKDDTLKYLIAEVSHTAVVRNGEKTVYLLGCRFTGRLDLDGAPGAVLTAKP